MQKEQSDKKRQAPRFFNKSTFFGLVLPFILIILLFTASLADTLAYRVYVTPPVVNSFTPAVVSGGGIDPDLIHIGDKSGEIISGAPEDAPEEPLPEDGEKSSEATPPHEDEAKSGGTISDPPVGKAVIPKKVPPPTEGEADSGETSEAPADEGKTRVVRARISLVLIGPEGETSYPDCGALSKPRYGQMILGDYTLSFDERLEDDWFFKDGCFYYRRVLLPGESPKDIFVDIALTRPAPEEDDGYRDFRPEVEVYTEYIDPEDAPLLWEVEVCPNGSVRDGGAA